ncbi:MAG: stress protein [Bacteroidota bacterium]
MIRFLIYTLVSVSFFQGTMLHGQSQFKLMPVSQVETSQNTVTCTVYEIENVNYLYSGGTSNKIDVFKISGDGEMQSVASYDADGNKGGIRGLVADQIEGNHFLFAGLKGANAIEVFKINSDGTLNSVFVMPDTDSTYLERVITLQVVHMKSASYLFAGGLETKPGLSAYKITAEGKLEHIQSMADNEHLYMDGIIGMSVHKIDGKTFLFAGGFHDNGLGSFRVYEDGHFVNINNIGDDYNLYLNGTYPVISASKGGWNFVVVGHRHHSYYEPGTWIKDSKSYYYHGDAVSVFIVDELGQLKPRSAFKGNSETMIEGQTRLHKLPLDDKYDVIAAATRDNKSIQLCLLNNKGRLIDAGKIDTGFEIYYGLAGQKIGEKLFLFAGDVNGSKMVAYRLDPVKE